MPHMPSSLGSLYYRPAVFTTKEAHRAPVDHEQCLDRCVSAKDERSFNKNSLEMAFVAFKPQQTFKPQ